MGRKKFLIFMMIILEWYLMLNINQLIEIFQMLTKD